LARAASLGKIKNKILVMSGKGGVGKSTVSVNLALGLAEKGYQVGLMDVDIHGPDVVRMLNMKGNLDPNQSADGLIPPLQYNDRLKVVSLEYMMRDRDEAIIWRGPLKIQAIRQFVADMDWGELDYLIIDAPPGTGDEPLSVAQTIPHVKAVVVTTPQKVALADVRKSINFCKAVKVEIVGVVENMSGFVCPHCDQTVDIFKSGGGEDLARELDLPFLGKIPMDPKVVWQVTKVLPTSPRRSIVPPAGLCQGDRLHRTPFAAGGLGPGSAEDGACRWRRLCLRRQRQQLPIPPGK
jgi:ATP-binding protein involved in chromosome partitioning